MQFQCLIDLEAAFRRDHAEAQFGLEAELCPPDMVGDITLNCFRLARPLRGKPVDLAERARAFLAEHADVAQVEVIKAFVNISLQPAALFRDTLGATAPSQAGALPEPERLRVLVEYSAPNTNKPQHLGHVRNNTLGLATTGLLARVGHTVIPVNLVNDRGIHICKSMLAYERFGEGVTPQSAGKKGDHLVGDFYVKFDLAFREQLAELKQQRPELAAKSAEELQLETEIGRAAQDLLVAWEDGDPQVRALWSQMNSWVLAGFAETYRRLGVAFTRTYYESETYRVGKDSIVAGLASGACRKRDDGATIVDLGSEKLGEKVVLRSDGTSVYVTQDIGTTQLKYDDFQPDKMVWIVGDEQIHHFKVLFAILRRLGCSYEMHHMAYGMVNLPSGRMKSREGTVVDADDLCDEVQRLAADATRQRWPELAEADLTERAERIGLAALKFMLLKVSPKTTMTFNPEESVRFEGDTGPFVQYNYARIRSMLREVGTEELAAAPDWNALGEPEERAVALQCARYGDVLRRAAGDLDPSTLAGYLLELARCYSAFYNRHSVLKADSPARRRARLALCDTVQQILADGLRTLSITPLEQM